MKHILLKKSLECGLLIVCMIFGMYGYQPDTKEKIELVSRIRKEECRFCGEREDSVLKRVQKMREDNEGNLERDPGVGFLNINTGEWIDLQLWDTISGKRGREEIYFGAEKASTLKFQTMKDRGYTEGSISLNGGSQDWEAAQENLCDTCLEHVQESICEYMYTDCYENQLVPIRDNYIFFLMGDYAVFTETADLPAKLKFLIFYASEAEYWQQQE